MILQSNTTGRLITALRGLHGMSQAELGRKCNLHQKDISNIERGLQPSPEHVEALEAVFGLKFDAPEVDAAVRVLAGQPGPEVEAGDFEAVLLAWRRRDASDAQMIAAMKAAAGDVAAAREAAREDLQFATAEVA